MIFSLFFLGGIIMTNETKYELLKAHYYGRSSKEIAKILRISVEEVEDIIKENPDFLKELEARDYGEA